MVSRHCKDDCKVELIGLIKLLVVFGDLSIEIHAVPGNLQKRETLSLKGNRTEIDFYTVRNQLLRNGIADTLHIAFQVKNHFPGLHQSFADFARNNVLDI